MEYTIKMKDSNPIKQPSRCIPFHLRKEVNKIVEETRKQKAIRNLVVHSSPLPAVMVKKKKGSIRFCVDYEK